MFVESGLDNGKENAKQDDTEMLQAHLFGKCLFVFSVCLVLCVIVFMCDLVVRVLCMCCVYAACVLLVCSCRRNSRHTAACLDLQDSVS